MSASFGNTRMLFAELGCSDLVVGDGAGQRTACVSLFQHAHIQPMRVRHTKNWTRKIAR